jgi:hypothetical protein
MKKIVLVIMLLCSLLLVSVAQAGVEPSPFKVFLKSQIDVIIERIAPLTEDPLGGAGAVQGLANDLLVSLQSIDTNHITRQRMATKSIIIMERISGALSGDVNYQLQALYTLSRLVRIGFDPQPEPPGYADTCLTVLDRISAAGFDPQPEPPGRGAAMAALYRISAIGFDPQPEPPGKALEIMGLFDAVTAIAFDPQPEPPGRSLREMFDILDLIGTVAIPEVPS